MTTPQRLRFACGQLGVMLTMRFLVGWNLRFADQMAPSGEMLFDASLVGLVFLLARFFDGVTDPVAGTISDRWARGGKERRRLLWFAFFVPTVGLLMVFLPDHAMPGGLRWALLLGGLFVFFVGYTFYAIPYWSLIDDYAGDDVGERRILSNLLGAGLMLATALVFLFSGWLIEHHGYFIGTLAFAAPAMVLMILPYYAAPTRPMAPPPASGGPAPSMASQIRQAVSDRRFVALMFLFSGSQMAFTVMSAAAPFIAGRLLGGTDADVATIMGPFLGTAILFFAFAPSVSRRFGWEKAMVGASVALAAVYAGTAALGYPVIGSPMQTGMLLFSLGGPMAAVLLGLEGEAITDCARAADGEVTSIYWGVFNFFVKTLNGLAFFLTGALVALAREPGYETSAVRAMGLTAGGLLLLGLMGYLVVRVRRVEGDA